MSSFDWIESDSWEDVFDIFLDWHNDPESIVHGGNRSQVRIFEELLVRLQAYEGDKPLEPPVISCQESELVAIFSIDDAFSELRLEPTGILSLEQYNEYDMDHREVRTLGIAEDLDTDEIAAFMGIVDSD